MKKNEIKEMLTTIIPLFEEKGINKTLILEMLVEIFAKAFKRDSKFDINDPIAESDVDVKIDLEKGKVDILRHWIIADPKDITDGNRLIKLPTDSELLVGRKDIKIGSKFTEEIDLKSISLGKSVVIKQLLKQKINEFQKLELYNNFKDEKDKIISAKIESIEAEYILLEYKGAPIFLSKKSISDRDSQNLEVGSLLNILISEVKKNSKDEQIIATRISNDFIYKLFERENSDIKSGLIQIKSIARIPGKKIKIAVYTDSPNMDSVGSILGIRAKKLEPIKNELNGEQIDILKFNSDKTKFIQEAIFPGKMIGIKYRWDNRNKKEKVIIVVPENSYFETIGKFGLNIKLASILVGSDLVVVKLSSALADNLDFEKIKPLEQKKNFGRSNKEEENNIELEEFSMNMYEDN